MSATFARGRPWMAFFRRKRTADLVAGFASRRLPWPLNWILGSRWITRLLFLAVSALVTLGIFVMDWSSGWPKLSIDRDRAAEVGDIASSLGTEVRARIPAGVAERIGEHLPDGLADTVRERIPRGADDLREQLASALDPQRLSSGGDASVLPRTGTAAAQPWGSSATIRIATFNIQVFGVSKAHKPEVMDVLASVVRRFDVVAIQELRTTDTSVLDQFLNLINTGGGTYQYVVGPRLGRTSSKEQYVFVYDAARVDIDPQSVITIDDPQDLLHREPLIARFQVRSPGGDGFSFILANIHTDPDETDTELDALGDVFLAVQNNAWREDDVILLGDLNVSYDKTGRLGQIPNIAYTVHGEPTNTRRTKSYDNLVFDRTATLEYTGVAGILDLQSEFGLTDEQTLDVSDHLPVWAEFTMLEHGAYAAVASQPADPLPGRQQGRLTANPLSTRPWPR